ncbi:MAG: response regulator [Candidatus Euphemobacter frigidus]|nr:response regulator [Candidatus Euphemobacter frigidus]MDP8274809.1 response regulator [Candidatus Euphemobacter frigidus]
MSRVLVVDDDNDTCWLISCFLKDDGYDVDSAHSGRDALRKISHNRYDLIILDIRLYKISGLTVLEKVQAISPSTRTIMISAYGDKSTRERAGELEVYDFMEKPVDMTKLMKVAKKALK